MVGNKSTKNELNEKYMRYVTCIPIVPRFYFLDRNMIWKSLDSLGLQLFLIQPWNYCS